eukprot:9153390-Pyramimonas_sp.AAC.1
MSQSIDEAGLWPARPIFSWQLSRHEYRREASAARPKDGDLCCRASVVQPTLPQPLAKSSFEHK